MRLPCLSACSSRYRSSSTDMQRGSSGRYESPCHACAPTCNSENVSPLIGEGPPATVRPQGAATAAWGSCNPRRPGTPRSRTRSGGGTSSPLQVSAESTRSSMVRRTARTRTCRSARRCQPAGHDEGMEALLDQQIAVRTRDQRPIEPMRSQACRPPRQFGQIVPIRVVAQLVFVFRRSAKRQGIRALPAKCPRQVPSSPQLDPWPIQAPKIDFQASRS